MKFADTTPLLVAPDATDTVGRALNTTDFLARLRLLNPRLYVHTQGPQHSGVWLGVPGTPGARFLGAVTLGLIPEWTQVDACGQMTRKGWRAVLVKIVRAGAATQDRVNAVFGADLARGITSALCRRCVREGRREVHNGGEARLCPSHDALVTDARVAKSEEAEILARLSHQRQRVYNV